MYKIPRKKFYKGFLIKIKIKMKNYIKQKYLHKKQIKNKIEVLKI